MVLESNQKEENVKEQVTKEMDSIKVPKGFKEELWIKVEPIRKKGIFNAKVLPYIAAIACIAILIPLMLSALPSDSETASNDLSGKTFNVAYTPVLLEDVDNPIKYESIMKLEFLDRNVVINLINEGEGTYELKDDGLVLRFENENESLEIKFTLNKSDKEFSEYSALISDVKFDITDTDKISHFQNLALKLIKGMPVEFLKK